MDSVERYGGTEKAIDMGHKIAKIVKCGKELLKEGYVYDLFMRRDKTVRTEVSLTDNPMVAIAMAALGD